MRTLRVQLPFVCWSKEEKKRLSRAWITSNLWGPQSPNFWTSQFFSLSLFKLFLVCFVLFCFVLFFCYFECEYPFIDKSMVILERLNITFTSNGKLEFVPRDQVSPLLVLLFIISTHKLEVLRNFLSIRIVLGCFYLLIFLFWEIFTDLNLTFAICRIGRAQTEPCARL